MLALGARVVHEDAQLVGESDAAGVGDVETLDAQAPRGSGSQIREVRAIVDATHRRDDVEAPLRELERDPATDAATRPGHDRGSPCFHHSPLLT